MSLNHIIENSPSNSNLNTKFNNVTASSFNNIPANSFCYVDNAAIQSPGRVPMFTGVINKISNSIISVDDNTTRINFNTYYLSNIKGLLSGTDENTGFTIVPSPDKTEGHFFSNAIKKMEIKPNENTYKNTVHTFEGSANFDKNVNAQNTNKYVVPSSDYPTIQNAIDAINAEYLADNTKNYSIFLKNGSFGSVTNLITVKQGCVGIRGINKNNKLSSITARLLINISGPFSLNDLSINSNVLNDCVNIQGSDNCDLYFENCLFYASAPSGGQTCINNFNTNAFIHVNYCELNISIIGQYFYNSSGGYAFFSHCKMSLFGSAYGRVQQNNGVIVLDNCNINGYVILSGTLGGMQNTTLQDINLNQDQAPIWVFGTIPYGLSFYIVNCYLQSDNTSGNEAMIGDSSFLISYSNVAVVGRKLVAGPTATLLDQLSNL